MATTRQVLSDALLQRFAARCAGYDRDNRFCDENFADLRQAGYLTMPVPEALWPARDLGRRRGRAEDRARLPAAHPSRLADGRDLGHDGDAGDAQR
jgi:hypothetical protein